MNKVKLPPQVCGKWIWLKDYTETDTFLIFRTEINGELLKGDIDFWISASTVYQLFINDRLVGYGPKGHHRTDSCYIDQHNAGYYVEPGRNVIAVKVYYSKTDAFDSRPPGFWCQIAAGKDIVCCSDESWHVLPADFWAGSRPAVSPDNGLTQVFRAEFCPWGWASLDLNLNAFWKNPDMICPIDDFALRPELYPIPPPVIAPEAPEFTCCSAGKIVSSPQWSGVRFKNNLATGRAAFAAVGYIFSEENKNLPVKLFSDVPFKLYCNNELVDTADNAKSLPAELKINPGWNKIVLFQVPTVSSMGFMMLLSDAASGNLFKIKQDMLDSADDGWCTTGPLRLKIADATPSLNFERLRMESCVCRHNTIPDIEALFDFSQWENCEIPADDNKLVPGEFLTWRLPALSYGFVKLSIDAGAGDIVDVAISPDCSSKKFAGNGRERCVNTIFCRNGNTSFLQFSPSDCVYVTVYCRHARGGVRISQLQFKELRKEVYRQAAFRCSNEFLNQLWDTGCSTLNRAISMVPTAEARKTHDVFLFDAYADAINSAVILGDSSYLAAGLRQFTDAQLENGDIPVITHGERRQLQLHHMLFLPQWILHNYSFSGSSVELEKSIPVLDSVRKFFESMIDPDIGMLVFPENWHTADSRFSRIDFSGGRVSGCLSSLFCRFLLSAAEVYRVQENRKGDYFHCLRLAEDIAENIRKHCKNGNNGLFFSWADSDAKDPAGDCFTNICALYGGVMAPEDFENFFFEFFNYDPPFEKFDSMTAYSSYLFTEMMFACSQRRWVYRYMLDYWQKRFDSDRGGWLNETGNSLEKTSFANGAMISPNVFLVKEILGIRHGSNGQQVWYFHPGVDFVERAEGTVPLNNGRLQVKWQRTIDGGLDVTLEANAPVTIMPELSVEHLKKTSFALSEQITLIKPPADFEDELDF